MKKLNKLLFMVSFGFFFCFINLLGVKAYTAPSNLNGEYFTIKLTDLYDFYEDNGVNDVLYQLYTDLDPHEFNSNMDFTIFGTSQALSIFLYNNSSCGTSVVPNFSNWNTYFAIKGELYKSDNNYVYSRVTLSDKCTSREIVVDIEDVTYEYLYELITDSLNNGYTSGVYRTGSMNSIIGDVLSNSATNVDYQRYYDVTGTYASGNGNYAIDKEWGMYPIYSTNNAGIYYSYTNQSLAPSGSHYFPSLVVHYYGETQVADDFYEHDSNAINHYTGNLGYNLPRLKTYFDYYEDVLPPNVINSDDNPVDDSVLTGRTLINLDNNYVFLNNNGYLNLLNQIVLLDDSSNRNGLVIVVDKEHIKFSFYDKTYLPNDFYFNYSIGIKNGYIYSIFDNSYFVGDNLEVTFTEFKDNFASIKSTINRYLNKDFSGSLVRESIGFNYRYLADVLNNSGIYSRGLHLNEYSYLFYSTDLTLKYVENNNYYHTTQLLLSNSDDNAEIHNITYSINDNLPSIFSLYSYENNDGDLVIPDDIETEYHSNLDLVDFSEFDNSDLGSIFQNAKSGISNIINACVNILKLSTSLFSYLPLEIRNVLITIFTLGGILMLIILIRKIL